MKKRQEKLSLSDRFGKTILFAALTKRTTSTSWRESPKQGAFGLQGNHITKNGFTVGNIAQSAFWKNGKTIYR